MNINVILGVLSFIAWSAFSTWFYVTQIMGLPKPGPAVEMTVEIPVNPEPNIDSMSAELASDTTRARPVPPPKLSFSIEKSFYFEKNGVTPVERAAIVALADSISQLGAENLQITILGYTCDLGSSAYNKELGLARAESVRKLLEGLNATFEVASLGESAPEIPNISEPNRAQNRRITLKISTAQ